MSFDVFIFLFFLIYGICIGSFLNVVIYRLPRKLSIAKGRSMCPKCEHTLGVLDLVPVFSWIFLRAKCRYCGEPIAPRYPLVELLCGISFGFCGLVYGFSFYALLLCIFVAVLIAAWFIDLDFRYIPDRFSLIILALAIFSLFTGPQISIVSRLIGGVGLFALMLLLSFVTGGGIGGGDMKLIGCSGLLLGYQKVIPAFFFAYILAAIVYLPAYLRKKLPKNFEVPMAPFFAVSLILFALFGDPIISFYFALWS